MKPTFFAVRLNIDLIVVDDFDKHDSDTENSFEIDSENFETQLK